MSWHFRKLGVPMLLMVGLGTFGMSYLMQSRIDYSDSRYKQQRKQEQLGVKRDVAVSPADYYKKIYFELSRPDDDWEMVRVPRGDHEN